MNKKNDPLVTLLKKAVGLPTGEPGQCGCGAPALAEPDDCGCKTQESANGQPADSQQPARTSRCCG